MSTLTKMVSLLPLRSYSAGQGQWGPLRTQSNKYRILQGCVSSLDLFILYTNDCASKHSDNFITKLSDDTAILSLMCTDSSRRHYLSEMGRFVQWCHDSHLVLSVGTTKEMVFDP